MTTQPTGRTTASRIGSLVAATAAISVLHYVTDPSHIVWHEVYQRLYYAPLILGAYWYGVLGGLLMAAFTSLVYLPHIRVTWSDNVPYAVNQYASLLMFHAIGLLVGALATSERRLTARYRGVAASLEDANRELRESGEQLRRADRLSALGQVAAGLAHEIRNPLGSIRGALEILASRAGAGTPEAEFSQLAMREVGRLEGLVTEFLTFARPRAPELRETSLDEVIARVVSLLRPEAERADISLEVDLKDGIPPLLIDPQQIGQVLMNVVLNGIQASPRGARVNIRAGRDADAALVDVTDEGPGIDAAQRARIFDPFFTTKQKGTGLGLAISSRIVAAHGGSIEAREGRAKGAHIQVRLPFAPSPRGAAERTGQAT